MNLPVRLTEIHDPDKNFLIRVCMLVEDASPGSVVAGSVVKQCQECHANVWYATQQVIPEVPDGVVVDGEIVLCMPCTLLHQIIQAEPPKWLGPLPGGFPI